MRRFRISVLIGLFFACALMSVPAHACSVPVFQWALEQWEPDLYELYVFNRGSLADAERAILETRCTDANVNVHVVDIDGDLSTDETAVWQAQESPTFPWLVLRHPVWSPVVADLWTGPLTAEALNALFDSPARSQVAANLLEGVPAAWIVLESGDPEKDNAAATSLQDELSQLEKALRQGAGQMPGEVEWDPSNATFPVVRVRRDDPAEDLLVEMLLRTEPDLMSYDEPMAFPVFGRGRALYALVGAGINSDTIQEACLFLTGQCSCLVKQQNPGTDLLVTADWRSIEDAVFTEIVLPPLEAAPVPPPEPAEPTESDSLLTYALAAAAGALALLVGATLFMARKTRRSTT